MQNVYILNIYFYNYSLYCYYMCNEMMAFFKQNIDNLNLNEHFIICKAITVKYMCISTDECIIANVNGSNTKDRALYMIR